MASQVDLTSTQYMLVRRILVPKHKGNVALAKRKQMLRGKSLLEKEEKTEKKWDYMQPVSELETIMKHFDAKFSGERVGRTERSRIVPRKVASVKKHDPDSLNIERKIKNLINLPALKSIKTQAERHRNESMKQWTAERQQHKSTILTNFSAYLNSQLKIIPKNRFPTIT